MKLLLLCLLVLALVCEGLGLLLWSPQRAGEDYQDIMHYVLSVEKEGFRSGDFEKFAVDRKVMQKDIYILPSLARTCHLAALLLIAASCGVALSALKKNEPNQPSQTTPGLRPSVSGL
jgi:hypothetical protein